MGFESNALAAAICRAKFGLLAHSKTAPIVQGACPSNRRIAIPARAGNFWHSSIGIPHVAVAPAYLTKMVLRGSAPQRRPKSMPPCGVSLKWLVCFVVESRRLIIQSRLDSPPRIRDISDPSQSRPLLGQAPIGTHPDVHVQRNVIYTGNHQCLPAALFVIPCPFNYTLLHISLENHNRAFTICATKVFLTINAAEHNHHEVAAQSCA